MRLTVNSDAALQNAIGELREQFKAKRYITVNLSSGNPLFAVHVKGGP